MLCNGLKLLEHCQHQRTRTVQLKHKRWCWMPKYQFWNWFSPKNNLNCLSSLLRCNKLKLYFGQHCCTIKYRALCQVHSRAVCKLCGYLTCAGHCAARAAMPRGMYHTAQPYKALLVLGSAALLAPYSYRFPFGSFRIAFHPDITSGFRSECSFCLLVVFG